MQIIAAYVGETRHVLEDSGQILSRANQALATLERYKLRLDEEGLWKIIRWIDDPLSGDCGGDLGEAGHHRFGRIVRARKHLVDPALAVPIHQKKIGEGTAHIDADFHAQVPVLSLSFLPPRHCQWQPEPVKRLMA